MTLEHAALAGARAKDLLADPVIEAAFAKVEADAVERWKNSRLDDAVGREKLFSFICAARLFKAALEQAVADGEMARAEIAMQRQLEERHFPSWPQR